MLKTKTKSAYAIIKDKFHKSSLSMILLSLALILPKIVQANVSWPKPKLKLKIAVTLWLVKSYLY